ncbi:MAG: hypothetical protein JWQ49_132 [Edaphobacter sp.]|nr:hypothetical protein [Edaphobacter sp.]
MRNEGRRTPGTVPFRSKVKSALGWLAAITAPIAIYSFFIYAPLSITPNTQLKYNAITTPFSLTNGGRFGITNVEASCEVKSLDTIGLHVETDHSMIREYMRPVSEIDSGESTTIYCDRGKSYNFGSRVLAADIIISATYSARLLPFVRLTKSARFVTDPSEDGKIHWIPKSLSQK